MYQQSIFARLAVSFVVATSCTCLAQSADAAGFCTQTADTLLAACTASVEDDEDVGKAICNNITNTGARNTCLKDLARAESEASTLCEDQHDTRLAACGVLGEG